MSSQIAKCKITVLKRMIDRDLIDQYLENSYEDVGPCEIFEDGQEFLLESEGEFSVVPEGFCAWAWADIRKDILTIATGGNIPGYRRPGTVITGCTDWFRPVVFKVERVESA
jgi:uncharacterized repeat protein (TIGR04076 family)